MPVTPEMRRALLDRIDQAWAELERTVQALGPRVLSDVHDPAGWAAKDHLMHVAVWEEAFLAGLDGRPTHEGLGLDAATAGQDGDRVNAVLFERHRERTAGKILEHARVAHAAVRARLASIGDAELARVASEGGSSVEPEAILAWIQGFTVDHYEEHQRYIRALADGRSASVS